ncbi:leucine--tRNA ligase [Ferruginibacter sp. HRS2-29]|uniref:leucine--tRNA ligase n=1 Tax=Ferruginibacter sp. HRS2-29 TaxID=2487334 RepID=UPI0020CC0D5E|nr:class I tRNA ligase family protein [Ferruginibacter sp. HRS2-29]MCP9752537.1 leucine--tRNA ligase [Ferruginibacter sp. HRS2-29]
MEYNFREIEKKWQQSWKENKTYSVTNESTRPKCYVLDMFPYPSGAGLHVGHPLGYIASDIYSRYKRLKGFNVLHPMGFDSFGLPAEQYAIETGQHPADTTEKNISTFKSQLDKIGFCYDWDREVRTSDPKYYKWTQWLFLQLFNSYFCNTQQKARPIADLIKKYETSGNKDFTAEQWNNFSKKEQEDILMQRRLAFSSFGEVNWCEALGTVLANDEVVNGVSERGGFPVVKKKMRQWYLRITAYADRLLQGLETVNFSDAMKEMQRNWIGKSEGAEMEFAIAKSDDGQPATDGPLSVKVYTTRPDTIFGVDFLVLAPEHELVNQITTADQRASVDEYLTYVKSRSDRERMAEVKQVTGCFTGAYAINPFDETKKIPVWIAEYVLAGYGTGAIMAVPCGDQRDYGFARHFNISITNIIGDFYNGEEANPTKEATLENSGFLTGLLMKDAIGVAIDKIEELGIGKRKKNYRMRDAGFSRQRYWGEPFPIKWIDGVAVPLEENELPLELPHVEKYGPGPEGEGPLANIPEWTAQHYETSTMPGYAGSSWYFLRYMDPQNDATFCDRKASDYWNQVDVYIGGTEHAVGHLLYSRMWTKVMYDLGLIGFDEPFKKLVNQGMIQGVSAFANVIGFNFGTNLMAKLNEEQQVKINKIKSKFKNPEAINFYISEDLMKYVRITHNFPTTEEEKNHMEFQDKIYTILLKQVADEISKNELEEILAVHPINNYYKVHVPIEYVNYKDELDEEKLKKENSRFSDAEFLTMNGIFICSREVEKMSKSKFNTINPDELCDKYGADTFRMYEMFLGPVEMSKPWDTKGIEGVHRFLRKLWRLFFDELKGKVWTDEKATDAELKVLHKTIKKIDSDTEQFSYNTAVSAFMISVNELADLKCHKKEVLEQLLILITPYAPHIAEELWDALGNEGSVLDAAYPAFEAKYLVEATKEYPVSVNGKLRTSINIATDAEEPAVREMVLANEVVQKWLEGKEPKKIIFVKGKMVNVVI